MRRKASQDTNDRCFGAPNASLPSTSPSVGRGGVPVSNVVEEGQVKNVPVLEPTASSSCSGKSPVIGSKRKTSPSQMSRKNFEMVSPVTSLSKSYTDDPSFGAAFDREASHRSSGHDRRALPFFDFAKKKKTRTHKSLHHLTAFIELFHIFLSAFDYLLYIVCSQS